MSLGSNIRRLREQKGLTLEQLSERSDVDIGTISALENRDSERSKFAAALARGLDVDLQDLLDVPPPWSARAAAAASLVSAKPAAEPPATYGRPWPFQHLSPEDLAQMDPVQLAQIEGFALGLLTSGKRRRAVGM